MFNNFFNLIRACVGLRLIFLLLCLVLIVITFYQLILTLFIPCFYNVLIALVEFCILVCLSFYVIFGL